MGGKHNKGCCTHCPYYCTEQAAADCSEPSTTEYHITQSIGSTFHGTGDSCCDGVINGPTAGDPGDCLPFVYNTIDTGDCQWLSNDCLDCDVSIELTIGAGPTATLTYTINGSTLVYKPLPGYNPLCVSAFAYSAADSDPPLDCSWMDRVCVVPVPNPCCPEHNYPDTLEVATEVLGIGDCSCGSDTPARRTLTRVPIFTPPPVPYRYFDPHTVSLSARWIGIVDIGSCGHFLYVTMECVFNSGRYRMYMSFNDDDDLGNCYPSDEFATEETDSCDPFIFHFVGSSDDAHFCCPGSFRLNMTVFDPT